MEVPFSVPSLLHSCTPFPSSLAAKKRVPSTSVSHPANEPCGPGLMSLTKTVPLSEPSLFHSSWPWFPSAAVKNRVPLTFVSCRGFELLDPSLMSFTRWVPAAVPSVTQSSTPRSFALRREERFATNLRE